MTHLCLSTVMLLLKGKLQVNCIIAENLELVCLTYCMASEFSVFPSTTLLTA